MWLKKNLSKNQNCKESGYWQTDAYSFKLKVSKTVIFKKIIDMLQNSKETMKELINLKTESKQTEESFI